MTVKTVKVEMMASETVNLETMSSVTLIAKKSPPNLYDWAQIALINEINWCIIGPYIQATGLLDTLSFENVQCPVVLTTDIPRITKTRIFKQYVAFSGVSNIDGMISDLVEAGGVVSYP